MSCDFLFVYFITQKRQRISQKSGCVERNEIVQHFRPSFMRFHEVSHASLSNVQELVAALKNTQNLDSFLCDPLMSTVLEGLELSLLTSGERGGESCISCRIPYSCLNGKRIPDLLDVSLLCASLKDLVS